MKPYTPAIYTPITLKDAHDYSAIHYKAFYSSMKNGHLPYRIFHEAEGIPKFFHIDDACTIITEEPGIFDLEWIKQHPEMIVIPLSALPPFAIRSYIEQQCKKAELFIDVDLTSVKHWASDREHPEVYPHVLRMIDAITRISCRKLYSFSLSEEELLRKYLLKYQLPYSRYKRLRTDYLSLGLDVIEKLHQGIVHENICPFAENYIVERLIAPHSPSQDDIIHSLIAKAALSGKEYCDDCPFRSGTESRKQLTIKLKEIDPHYILKRCHSYGNGIICPEKANHSVISRIKKKIPPSALYFYKYNYSDWDAQYGSKVIRDMPEKINEYWSIDPHEVDILLYDRHTHTYHRPWVIVILDLASGAIVGSIVSYYHNSITIGEAICRAACISSCGPVHFHGLPEYLQCDNGTELKSQEIRELLRILGVKQIFTRKRSPWSKPVERTFETIEDRYIHRMIGFCGGVRKNKYREYLNEKIEKYTSANAFLSIEEFADFWFHYVVPSFNDFGARHETPNEIYLTKPRARTLTPSWATMSVLLSPKYPVVVKPQGIYFGKNRYYDDLLLKKHVGQTVYIYGYESVYPDSICAMFFDESTETYKFLGEIPLKEHLRFHEEDRVKLMRSLVLHNLQEKQLIQGKKIINTISSATEDHYPMYERWRIDNHTLVPFFFSEEMEPFPEQETTHLSDDYLKVALWNYETYIKILKEHLSQK